MSEVLRAAENMDWEQVRLNGGPPCFHLGDDGVRFCGRARRWEGHGDIHPFVPLDQIIAAAREEGRREGEAVNARQERWLDRYRLDHDLLTARIAEQAAAHAAQLAALREECGAVALKFKAERDTVWIGMAEKGEPRDLANEQAHRERGDEAGQIAEAIGALPLPDAEAALARVRADALGWAWDELRAGTTLDREQFVKEGLEADPGTANALARVREEAVRWCWQHTPDLSIGLTMGFPVKRNESADEYVARALNALGGGA